MKNETLTELLRIYSQLPSGVIVFKEGAVYFINDHLRDVLTLGRLPSEQCVEVICGLLALSADQEALYDFLSSKRFFAYKTKYVQIASKSVLPYEIFVFTLMDEALLEHLGAGQEAEVTIEADEDRDEEATQGSEEHSKLLAYFKRRGKIKLHGVILYEGIPLIADNTVLQPFGNTLLVKVENKQMAVAQEGTVWILWHNEKFAIQGHVVRSDTKQRLVFLGGLQRIEKGFWQRETIRYDVRDEASLLFDVEGEALSSDLLDLSENTLRVSLAHTALLKQLTSGTEWSATLLLGSAHLKLRCRFLKEERQVEKNVQLVLAFTMEKSDAAQLRNWLNGRQITLIKAVKEQVRMLE